MGLSIPLASAILLLALLTSAGLFVGAMIQMTIGLRGLLHAQGMWERMKLEVELRLRVESIDARGLNFTVENTGSRTIFLHSEGDYRWNTVIIAYGGRSYPIDDYRVLEIRVSEANKTFNPGEHPYIAPGEEALIHVELPDEAPDISPGEAVLVLFASHYGVTAADEGVRTG